jgi:choline dehydrogenase-like flavoprotein
MNTPSIPIAPLCRVSLDMDIDGGGNADPAKAYTFIVGVGSGGLSPFEYALLDKRVGDRIRLEIEAQEMSETFEHLQPPLPASIDPMGPMVIEAMVTAVTRAETREIVKAMAAATGGCDCGCGCGGQCTLG